MEPKIDINKDSEVRDIIVSTGLLVYPVNFALIGSIVWLPLVMTMKIIFINFSPFI